MKRFNSFPGLKNINTVYPNGLSRRTCYRWFEKFKKEDFDLQDHCRSGRPGQNDNDRLKSLIESNPRQTLRELANIIECSQESIRQHLQQLGKFCKHGFGFRINCQTNRKFSVYHWLLILSEGMKGNHF